jgi:hypothetical protein
VQKNDRRTIGWASLSVSDIEEAGIAICFSDPNDVFVPGLIAGTCALVDCAFAELNMPNWAATMVMAARPESDADYG